MDPDMTDLDVLREMLTRAGVLFTSRPTAHGEHVWPTLPDGTTIAVGTETDAEAAASNYMPHWITAYFYFDEQGAMIGVGADD